MGGGLTNFVYYRSVYYALLLAIFILVSLLWYIYTREQHCQLAFRLMAVVPLGVGTLGADGYANVPGQLHRSADEWRAVVRM